MPATLPLELVLDIVRVYIQRDFSDEDWPAYHRRLVPLCLLNKYLKSIVQPVLWSHLSLSYAAELKKLAAADSTISHLFKHVKAFAGLHPLHCPRTYGGKQSFKLIRSTMPDVQSVALRAFGGRVVAIDRLGSFAALSSLVLKDFVLSEVSESLVLANVQDLSLSHLRIPSYIVTKILDQSYTPSLRRLYLAYLTDFSFPDDMDEPFLPIRDIDLRRVKAVQLKAETLEVFRLDLPTLPGPFSEETEILLSWTAAPYVRLSGSFELSRHIQIHILPYMLKQPTSQFANSISPVLDLISNGKLKVIFLPLNVRHRAAVPTWIQRGLRTLFDECVKAGISIYFYNDTSEDSSLRMSDAFLRFVDNPSMPDENPLKVESERRTREALPETDDGTLWEFAKGFDEGSESGEEGERGNVDLL